MRERERERENDIKEIKQVRHKGRTEQKKTEALTIALHRPLPPTLCPLPAALRAVLCLGLSPYCEKAFN